MTVEQKRMEEAAKRAAQRAVNQLRMSRHTLRAGAGQVTLVMDSERGVLLFSHALKSVVFFPLSSGAVCRWLFANRSVLPVPNAAVRHVDQTFYHVQVRHFPRGRIYCTLLHLATWMLKA